MAGEQEVKVDALAGYKAREELVDAWSALSDAMHRHCPDLSLLTGAGALKRLQVRALAHEMDRVREFLVTPMDDEW